MSEYNFILNLVRLSIRNDAMLGKVSFRQDIRQNSFLEKIRISRASMAFKAI